MPTRVQMLMGRLDFLKSERVNHEDTLQELVDLFYPFRGDISTIRGKGDERLFGVHDSTGMLAADNFSNFLMSLVLPEGVDWLRLQPPEQLEGHQIVRAVMDVSQLRALRALAGSNFYRQAGLWVRDSSILGNGTMLTKMRRPRRQVDGSTFTGFTFEAPSVRNVWWAIGDGDDYIMHVRRFTLPVVDAHRHFDDPGPVAKQLARDERHFENVEYLHFVYQNEETLPHGLRALGVRRRPWVSEFVAAGDMGHDPQIVRTSGFDVNPYSTMRWTTVDGETYGRGLGHLARPDAKGLQKLRELLLIAFGQDLLPPLMVEEDTAVELDIGPRGLMVISAPEKIVPQYLSTNANYDAANAALGDDRSLVSQAFMGSLLAPRETEPRSAAQTQQNRQMILSALNNSSTVLREGIKQTVASVISTMAANGAMPELAELERRVGQELVLDIDLTSPFFSAQKAAPLERLNAFIDRRIARFQAAGNLPEILEDLDWRKISEVERRLADVPAIFKTDEEIDALREVRAGQILDERVRENGRFAAEMMQSLNPQDVRQALPSPAA